MTEGAGKQHAFRMVVHPLLGYYAAVCWDWEKVGLAKIFLLVSSCLLLPSTKLVKVAHKHVHLITNTTKKKKENQRQVSFFIRLKKDLMGSLSIWFTMKPSSISEINDLRLYIHVYLQWHDGSVGWRRQRWWWRWSTNFAILMTGLKKKKKTKKKIHLPWISYDLPVIFLPFWTDFQNSFPSSTNPKSIWNGGT